ncbi:hypothetical protein NFI96_001374 [Prochilodus magdalenae]|nr:hypothetical protein NFI96_001374 [Prochilodus magdalenae]
MAPPRLLGYGGGANYISPNRKLPAHRTGKQAAPTQPSAATDYWQLKDQPPIQENLNLGTISRPESEDLSFVMVWCIIGGAVVIAFVVCWLPYHARRLMYCYVTDWTNTLYDFYHYFYMVTNVLFYVSSAINPVLYNLVSANYRQIFFSTLSYFCLPCRRRKKTRMFTRHSISICSNQTFSTNIVKETVY